MRRAISVMNSSSSTCFRPRGVCGVRDRPVEGGAPSRCRSSPPRESAAAVLMGDDHSHRFHDLHELARLDVAVAVFVELGEGLVDLFQLVAREKLRPWVLLDDFKIGRGERMQFDQRVIGHALLRRSDSRPPAGRAARPHEPLSAPSPRGGWDL
eukprot:CAMPEP_0113296772 /NCGR_PEP_ID=MMETSP0008_2-20120614/37166_1 /TAXON_ID=97485 /ORGANISM="Prymnesium parvum" /LENGTH=153 /DNA_ID=CAMNT_0000149585 /DNA_START=521 /DNA_END=983 /DNA_ORIENTATION=- /assembly_acc=CAM_ASM_000153